MKVINDLTPARSHIDECADHVVITNGYDRPRYFLPEKSVSGYLGFEDWSGYENKPVGTVNATTPTASANIASIDQRADGRTYVECVSVTSDDQYNGYVARNATKGLFETVADTINGEAGDDKLVVGNSGLIVAGDNVILSSAITYAARFGAIVGSVNYLAASARYQFNVGATGFVTSNDQYNGYFLWNRTKGVIVRIRDTAFTTVGALFVDAAEDLLWSVGDVLDIISPQCFVDDTITDLTVDTASGADVVLDQDIISEDDEYNGRLIKTANAEFDSGTLTSETDTVKTDSTKSWTVNEWAGYIYWQPETGQYSTIVSNTATALTLTSPGIFATVLDDYKIIKFDRITNITDTVDIEYPVDVLVFNAGSSASTWEVGDSIELTPSVDENLEGTKFYSIVAVPVNTNIVTAAGPILGEPTAPAVPIQATADGDTITFTIPVHPQVRVHDCGIATAVGSGTTITDSSKTWIVDQWIGYSARNVETGLSSPITANTATALTLSGSVPIAEDARFQIVFNECSARYIYASRGSTAEEAISGDFYFQDVIFDNTTTSFTLSKYIIGEILVSNRFPPPNAAACHSSGDVLYVGGGIEAAVTGTAKYISTPETETGAAVSIITDAYDGALSQQICRYTLTSGDWTEKYEGSVVTVTGAANSGNNVANAKITRVGAGWFEIVNNAGVAAASNPSMEMTIIPNVVKGDESSFTEGMVGAYIDFTDDTGGPVLIEWVDVINQILGLESKYIGDNADYTANYRIYSKNELYYSDYKNPHRFRSDALIEIGDAIQAINSIGQLLVIFCTQSLWRINTKDLSDAPRKISDQIYFDAPFSVCSNGQYLMFFDGEGFSLTDGVGVRSVTNLRAKNYLSNINKAQARSIQGVYNPVETRFEFYFPMGTETKNNYGLYIQEGTLNNVPVSRPDVNVLFSGYEDGRFSTYHGTSGVYEGGNGSVWAHEGDTDGLTSAGYEAVITDITGQVVTVQATEAIGWAAGSVICLYPALSGTYRQYMIESVVDNGLFEYELTFATGIDLTSFANGDYVLFGLIPFDYGIKWDDFQSPQYLKRVRELHIDLYGMTGRIFIDHHKDLSQTPAQSDTLVVAPTDSKLVFRFRQGVSYIYGFRIRGFSKTRMKINAIEKIFTVKT